MEDFTFLALRQSPQGLYQSRKLLHTKRDGKNVAERETMERKRKESERREVRWRDSAVQWKPSAAPFCQNSARLCSVCFFGQVLVFVF